MGRMLGPLNQSPRMCSHCQNPSLRDIKWAARACTTFHFVKTVVLQGWLARTSLGLRPRQYTLHGKILHCRTENGFPFPTHCQQLGLRPTGTQTTDVSWIASGIPVDQSPKGSSSGGRRHYECSSSISRRVAQYAHNYPPKHDK